MSNIIYGYCRISTLEQSIERQERNIKVRYPTAVILKEAETGTKIQERVMFMRMLKKVCAGDTIIFDSVSRMARVSDEGVALYEELFYKKVNLVFLKEPHINTDTYRAALSAELAMTGGIIDNLLEGINKYMMALAREQIKIAFDQAEKEVMDLRQRTKEGMVTAKLMGKQNGCKEGAKLVTKKGQEAKKGIRKYSKSFDGMLSDKDVIKIVGVSRNSYYKYKRELAVELEIKAQ